MLERAPRLGRFIGIVALALMAITRGTAASAQPDPHAGGPHGDNPHAGGHRSRGGAPNERFQPPRDGHAESPDLPVGTIELSVADRDETPVAGLPVSIAIVHSSVAKGDSHEKIDRVTDADGKVRLDDLEVGSANNYRIVAKVGEASFALDAIQLTDKAGQRALLHVYDAADALETVEQHGPFGIEVVVETSLKDEDIVVKEHCRIYDLTPVAWTADIEVPLPAGFKAFQTPDEEASQPVQVLETEAGAVLRGTVPPGMTQVNFGFHVPLKDSPTQSIDLSMFPNTVQVRLVSEASHKMSLQADGFTPAKFDKTDDGVSVLIADRQASDLASAIPRFTMTLNGLPTRGVGGYLAVILAGIALATAAAYRLARRGRTDLEPDALSDLLEAKETLIREIAALEVAHGKGVVGPKTYERSRGLLLDALARVVGRIEGAAVTPALR